MDINERISQWQKMTEADPANDMGWFSLGEAYKDNQQFDKAEPAFAKAVEINPTMTQAIALRCQMLIELNDNELAGPLLLEGYKLAAQRGDIKPQKAMASMITKLSLTLPNVEQTQAAASTPAATDSQILDARTNQLGTRMAEPPIKGPLGQYIADHYSEETWNEWIGMGTKVINEFRLDFSKIDDQNVFDQQMMLWLGFTEEDVNK